MLILAAGFGCSEQRKWNREQRKEMREMLRDYRQMAYLNDLTDAEFILFSDDVATALEATTPSMRPSSRCPAWRTPYSW